MAKKRNYVIYNGRKHYFESEKEKKALLKKASKTGRYTLQEGILTIIVVTAAQAENISAECGKNYSRARKVKENKQ